MTNFALCLFLASTAVVVNGFSENSLSFHTSCSSHCSTFVTIKETTMSLGSKQNQWNRAQRGVLASSCRRTQLAANGGMDAYEAQMAAMMARKRAISQPPSTADTAHRSDESAITSASTTKWSGQNSYTQILQKPQSDFSISYSEYASETIGADTCTVQRDAGSRKSLVEGQQKYRDISSTSTIEDIPYEMQLDDFLRSLQKEIRDATVTASAEASDEEVALSKVKENEDVIVDKLLQILSQNKKLFMTENDEEGTASSINPSSQPIQAVNQQQAVLQSSSKIETPSNADEQNNGNLEESMEDKFLKMLSNEIQYKKFLNQNPYSITDIEFLTLLNRFLDNLEDSTQKNNGKIKGQSRLQGKDMPKEGRKTVVVVSFAL
jgi:hypothetical protein